MNMTLKDKATDQPEQQTSEMPDDPPKEDHLPLVKSPALIVLSDGNDFPLERRILLIDKEEVPFNFLVVDSANKWDVATGRHSDFSLSVGSSSGDGNAPPKQVRFPLRGVSLKAYETIEVNNTVPQRPDDADTNEESLRNYEDSLEIALNGKRVAILEAATGKKIPGKTPEEKMAFLSQRRPAETERIFTYIQDNVCNFADGSGELLEQYEMMLADGEGKASVVEFNSFDDWETAVQSRYCFRINRPGDDYILEFPIQGISQEVRHKIDSDTREPKPPEIPRRDPVTRRFDPSQLVPNYEDPSWLQRVRAVNQLRTAMYLDAALMFPLPGSNYMEKYNWLSERLAGDVIKLKRFIESEIVGLGKELGFF